MCLIIKCRICHNVIPTQDTRRKICDEPECRRQAFLDTHRGPRVTDRSNCKFAFCKKCGVPIPTGSKRICYCDNCAKEAKREGCREYKRRVRAR